MFTSILSIMDWDRLSQIGNNRQSVVEVGNVRVGWPSQTHIDTVGGLVIDDLGHHLQTVCEFAGEGHLLVVSTVLPEDLDEIVVHQFLNKLVGCESMIQNFLAFGILRV